MLPHHVTSEEFAVACALALWSQKSDVVHPTTVLQRCQPNTTLRVSELCYSPCFAAGVIDINLRGADGHV